MLLDPLSDVLSLLRPHTYVAGGFDLRGRWSLGFEPHTGIKCYALLSGSCWLVVDGHGDALRLGEGDCVLLPYGRRFCLTNDLTIPRVPFEGTPGMTWRGGIATVDGGGETSLLGGHFAFSGTHADLLLGAMPPVAHIHEAGDKLDLRWTLERMRQELAEARPGGVLVAQHLAHLMLVQALRLYLAGAAGRHVGWLFALADPKLAATVGAIHADPGARWTLSALAAKAGMSRSSFARAFTATVGEPPIAYVTRWRMLLAAMRLSDGDQPVSAVAASIGYASDAAFSTAFKRAMGCAPAAYARSHPHGGASHPWSTTAVARSLADDGRAAHPTPIIAERR